MGRKTKHGDKNNGVDLSYKYNLVSRICEYRGAARRDRGTYNHM